MWLYIPKIFRSSHSAPALPGSTLDLNSLSQRLEPCVTWKGKLLQQRSWQRVLRTDASMRLLSGAISERLTQSSGAARYIASLPDIRVSRSARPARGAGAKILAISGRKSRESSANVNPSLYSSRTSPITSDWDFAKSRKSYDAWVTAVRRESLARRKSARLIFASGFSRWPSARAEDAESCGNHPGSNDSLTGAVRNWPTARAQDGKHASATQYELSRNPALDLLHVAAARAMANWKTPHGMGGTDGHTKPHDLVSKVLKWQTPGADSFRSRGGERKGEMGLDQQARNWSTPMAQDCAESGSQSYGRTLTKDARNWPTPDTDCNRPKRSANKRSEIQAGLVTDKQLNLADAVALFPTPAARDYPLPGQTISNDGQNSSASTPKLNPQFVEMLMDFPLAWTDCGASVMEWYPLWLHLHSLRLQVLLCALSTTPMIGG